MIKALAEDSETITGGFLNMKKLAALVLALMWAKKVGERQTAASPSPTAAAPSAAGSVILPCSTGSGICGICPAMKIRNC